MKPTELLQALGISEEVPPPDVLLLFIDGEDTLPVLVPVSKRAILNLESQGLDLTKYDGIRANSNPMVTLGYVNNDWILMSPDAPSEANSWLKIQESALPAGVPVLH